MKINGNIMKLLVLCVKPRGNLMLFRPIPRFCFSIMYSSDSFDAVYSQISGSPRYYSVLQYLILSDLMPGSLFNPESNVQLFTGEKNI